MATFLFDRVVFGPVISRRLGVSLGINLLPVSRKVCSFDCLYCECGLNVDGNGTSTSLPTHQMVRDALELKLKEMKAAGEQPDVITFAGNGEPTMHPDFLRIIDSTILLRNAYCEKAKISVLSNSSRLSIPEVVEGLRKVDLNILKLDSAIDDTVQILNRPEKRFNLIDTIQQLRDFPGKLIIQTLFCRGEFAGQVFDNTTGKELDAWLGALNEIKPDSVMIYSLSRDTPVDTIQKVGKEELMRIAEKVKEIGLEVEIS